MIDGKISGKQATHMMILFLLGSSLVTGGGMIAKQDSWISALVGVIMAVPLVAILGNLCKMAPGKDIFDMAYLVFGKIGGAIITVLFCLYTIHLGAFVIKNFSEYFQVVTIPETPLAVTTISSPTPSSEQPIISIPPRSGRLAVTVTEYEYVPFPSRPGPLLETVFSIRSQVASSALLILILMIGICAKPDL